MAKKGLGKGLDSLIPDFYDEDFDSNSTKSLEDILNEDSTSENQVDSTSEIDTAKIGRASCRERV